MKQNVIKGNIMQKRKSAIAPSTLAILAFSAALLAACSGEKPEALIASAKGYLEKNDPAAAAIQLKNALKQQDTGEVRFLLGKSLNATGEHSAALVHLRQAIEARFPAEAVHPELSKALLAQGEYKKLIAELGKASVSDPTQQAGLKCDIGEAYLSLGQVQEAKESFAAALAKVPNYARARAAEGRILAASGDIPGATAVADGILSAQADSPYGLSLKADLLSSQGKPDQAVEVLTSLVKVAPQNGQARFNLISLLIAGGKFEPAAAAIEDMKKTVPRDGRSKYLEGLLAFRKNEPAKARDAVLQVLSVAPEHTPSLLLAGASEFQLGSLSTAADYLRKVLTKAPNNLYARNLLVATYMRQGQHGKAEDALAPALLQAPNDPNVLRAAGEVAIASNKLKDAAKYYDQALALEKDNSATKTRLAQIRLASGETDRALADLEATSGGDKTQYQSDLALISTYVARKETDKALSAVATLEKKLPNDPLTYSVKGAVYLARNDNKNARVALEKALTLQPTYLPAARVLSGIDLAEKNPTAAAARMEAILAKDANNEGALLALAQVQSSAGLPRKDIAATFERGIKANPSSAAVRLAQVNFLIQGRDTKAALAAAQAAYAAIPNDPKILDVLGLAQLGAGETTAALESFNKLAKMQPDSPVPQLRLAAASYAAKQTSEPIEALRKALAIKPDMMEAQRGIIAMQLAAGKTDEALKEAKAVQKSRSKEAIGYALEGDILESQKKHAEAAKAYAEGIKRQATPEMVAKQIQLLETAGQVAEARAVAAKWNKENPNDPTVRFQMATSAMLKKDYKEAAEGYRAILAKQPDHLPTLNNLAWVLGEMKDPGAIGFAEKAFKLDPNNPGVLDTLGWILAGNGETAKAIDMLTKAVAGAPQEIEIRLHLAKVLIKSGDKTQARKELEEAAKISEKHPLKLEIDQLLRTL